MQGIAAMAGKRAARPRAGAGALALLVGLAAGCWGWGHHAPEEQASWFFERGEEWIVEALEDVDADEAQIEAARAVLEERRPRVTDALEKFFIEQRGLLRTLAGGAATPELLERHSDFEAEHERALQEIGALHAALGDAVGPSTWEEARARLRERAREHLEEE